MVIATSTFHSLAAAAWALARAQFGVIARVQLLELGYSPAAIRHRLETGRLHEVHRGIYAVGRPELTQEGRWMAATLAGGDSSFLADQSAAELWGYRSCLHRPIKLLVPRAVKRVVVGLEFIRSDAPPDHLTTCRGIPVVSVPLSLVQLASHLSLGQLERAINQADALDLIDPDTLRDSLADFADVKGVAPDEPHSTGAHSP